MRGIVLMLCILCLVFFATSFFRQANAGPDYSYAQIRAMLEEEKVDKILVEEHSVTLTLKEANQDGAKVVTYPLYDFSLFYEDFNDLVVQQWEDGILSDYEYPDAPSPAWIGSIVTWIIVLVVMVLHADFIAALTPAVPLFTVWLMAAQLWLYACSTPCMELVMELDSVVDRFSAAAVTRLVLALIPFASPCMKSGIQLSMSARGPSSGTEKCRKERILSATPVTALATS